MRPAFLQACTFLARSDLKKPTSRLAYTIGDSVKLKTRENINAEVKLRCLSLTILDNLCGMVCFPNEITAALNLIVKPVYCPLMFWNLSDDTFI